MNNRILTMLADEWEEYADEHILLMRCVNAFSRTKFEFVHVIKDELCGIPQQVRFRHGVQFMDDIDLENPDSAKWLDEQLNGVGYDGLDDFVQQTSPEKVDLRVKPDGAPDRYKNPTYIVDMMLLASLLIEVSDDPGIPMPKEEALRLVKSITGKEYKESNPCTTRFAFSSIWTEHFVAGVPVLIWMSCSGLVSSRK